MSKPTLTDLVFSHRPSFVTLYHGTNTKALPSIKEDGLVPGRGKGCDLWAQQHGEPVGVISQCRSPSVFVTDDAYDAKVFAQLSAEAVGAKPIVCTLHVPKKAMSKFKLDALSDNGPAKRLRFIGTIPKDWIASVKAVSAHRTQSDLDICS